MADDSKGYAVLPEQNTGKLIAATLLNALGQGATGYNEAIDAQRKYAIEKLKAEKDNTDPILRAGAQIYPEGTKKPFSTWTPQEKEKFYMGAKSAGSGNIIDVSGGDETTAPHITKQPVQPRPLSGYEAYVNARKRYDAAIKSMKIPSAADQATVHNYEGFEGGSGGGIPGMAK